MAYDPKDFRASWHNYYARAQYLITLKKSAMCPAFGSLAGSTAIEPGMRGSSYIQASEVGKAVKEALREYTAKYPMIELGQYALMPDHLHCIFHVKESLPFHFGSTIRDFKFMVRAHSGLNHVFEDGFNDQIIGPQRDLDTVYRYVRSNAYRLAIRREHPEYFQRVNRITVCGTEFAAYGNLQLLDNPFKDQVVVHRSDTLQVYEQHRKQWLYTAANGGVLVSPFISPGERAVRDAATDIAGRMIVLRLNGFPERFKPSGVEFDLCTQGRLLLMTPWQSLDRKVTLTRADAMVLNNLSQQIAARR